MRLLSEGAESRVFVTSIFGKSAVAKLRHAKAYRIEQIDGTLRKTRTKKEARAMNKAREVCGRVPALLGVGKFTLYMEKIEGTLLKDVKNQRVDYGEIGKTLAKMHDADVVHGDFTPANIIINKSGAWIIDFGLSDITDSIEDKALDLLLMKRSIDRKLYAGMESAYSKELKNSKLVLDRLADIEKRGRYQVRSLA